MSLRRFVWILLLVGEAACSSSFVNHAFQFSAPRDSPDVEILDYRYGDSFNASNPPNLRAQGQSKQAESVIGSIKRGDFLYVKWRVKSTDKIFEDMADLRGRMPRNYDGQTLYFRVDGPQLYVYLVSNEPGTSSIGANAPEIYRNRKSLTLYPAEPRAGR